MANCRIEYYSMLGLMSSKTILFYFLAIIDNLFIFYPVRSTFLNYFKNLSSPNLFRVPHASTPRAETIKMGLSLEME